MKTFAVQISNPSAAPDFAADTRPLAAELDLWLRKNVQGSCVGQGTNEVLALEVRAPDHDCFRPLIEAFCAAFTWGRNAGIVIQEIPQSELTRAQEQFARGLLIQPVKLTKTLFMTLPAGKFVVSNVLGGPNLTPSYAAYVDAAREERLAQWAAIVAARADQRNCYVFASQAAFEAWDHARWGR